MVRFEDGAALLTWTSRRSSAGSRPVACEVPATGPSWHHRPAHPDMSQCRRVNLIFRIVTNGATEMMPKTSGPTPTGRPPSTSERLVNAGLQAFSTAGFEGTSARRIERLAGVERGLVGYHFGSKQELWDRAIDLLFQRYTDELESLRRALRDVSRRERATAMLKAFARFNTWNPEFFRILVIEGHVKSERSERLAAHLRKMMTLFSDITEMSTAMPIETAIRWFQVIGAAGSISSLSEFAARTFGDELHNPDFIDLVADALAAIAMEEFSHDDGDPGIGLGRVIFLGPQHDAAGDPAAASTPTGRQAT
jgi:AcrR family transcriptional regulator